MKNKFYIPFVLFLFGISTILGQTNINNKKSEEIPLDPTVRHGTLENGFSYYIKRNDHPANSTEFHLVLKAGSLQENKNQWEYSHLLEHLGGFGTTNFPNLHTYFTKSGRYTHATNGFENTDYFVRIPSNDKEGLQSALQVVYDWAKGDILIDQPLIDVQRGAVLGEMRTNNPHQKWLSFKISEQIHRNAKYLISNSEQDAENIRNFNRPAFLDYLKKWYRPDLEAAIVVGDVDVDSMEVEIRKKFANLKVAAPKPKFDVTISKKDLLDGKNSFVEVLDTVESGLRMYYISKRLNRAKDAQTYSDYKVDVKDQLYDLIIQERSRSYTQDQYFPPFVELAFITRNPRLIRKTKFKVDFQSDRLPVIKKQFVKAMATWKGLHQQLTQKELESAKAQVKARYSISKTEDTRSIVQKLKFNFVTGVVLPSKEREGQIVYDVLDNITLKDIQEYATKQSDLEVNNDFIFFKGKNERVPDFKTIKKWLKSVKRKKVRPLNLSKPQITSIDHDMDLVAKAGQVEVHENEIGISTINMPNGITLILKPSTNSNTISINALRPLPQTLLSNREEYLANMLAPEAVRYLGAGSYTKFVLDDFIRNKKMRYNHMFGIEGFYMSARGNTEDFDELLKLIHLVSTSPRRDKEAFKAWKMKKRKELMGLWGRTSSDFFMDDVKALQYQGIPKLTLEDLESLELDDILEAYAKWCSSYEGYTFVVMGDFESKELAPKLCRFISSLPVQETPNTNTALKPDFKMQGMHEKIELNNIDQAFIRLYFPVTVDKGIKKKVLIKLITKALREKLYARLRVGTYIPTTYGDWVDPENGIYSFVVRFDSELGNENNMVQYALEEFRKFRQNGVDAEWLEDAIKDEMRSYTWNINSSSSGFWPDYIYEKKKLQEDMTAEVLQYKTILEHFISLEDVNNAAKKYLSEENLQQFLVVPKGYKEIK